MGQGRCCCSGAGSGGADGAAEGSAPKVQLIHAEEGAGQLPADAAAAELASPMKPRPPLDDADNPKAATTTSAAAALALRASTAKALGEGGGAASKAKAGPPKAASPTGASAGKLTSGSLSTTATPKQAAPMNSVFDTTNSMMSTLSAFDSLESVYQDMSKEERKETRTLVKEFVKGMVKGREFNVIAASGELRTCFCSLSRKLDKLKLSVGDKDKRMREILLADLVEVAPGGVEGQDPDGRAVTLTLSSDECLTFKLPDAEARDQLIACLNMFSNQARQTATK